MLSIILFYLFYFISHHSNCSHSFISRQGHPKPPLRDGTQENLLTSGGKGERICAKRSERVCACNVTRSLTLHWVCDARYAKFAPDLVQILGIPRGWDNAEGVFAGYPSGLLAGSVAATHCPDPSRGRHWAISAA